MAENQYGVSEPALTSDPIRARHPFGEFTVQYNVCKLLYISGLTEKHGSILMFMHSSQNQTLITT